MPSTECCKAPSNQEYASARALRSLCVVLRKAGNKRLAKQPLGETWYGWGGMPRGSWLHGIRELEVLGMVEPDRMGQRCNYKIAEYMHPDEGEPWVKIFDFIRTVPTELTRPLLAIIATRDHKQTSMLGSVRHVAGIMGRSRSTLSKSLARLAALDGVVRDGYRWTIPMDGKFGQLPTSVLAADFGFLLTRKADTTDSQSGRRDSQTDRTDSQSGHLCTADRTSLTRKPDNSKGSFVEPVSEPVIEKNHGQRPRCASATRGAALQREKREARKAAKPAKPMTMTNAERDRLIRANNLDPVQVENNRRKKAGIAPLTKTQSISLRMRFEQQSAEAFYKELQADNAQRKRDREAGKPVDPVRLEDVQDTRRASPPAPPAPCKKEAPNEQS